MLSKLNLMFFDNLLELEIADMLILKTILGKNPISTGVRINLKVQ